MKLFGIVNLTPDSFSDGAEHNQLDDALRFAQKLIDDGVDVLDVGGESTRPGYTPVSVEEEIRRIVPFIREARGLGRPISVDTYKPAVAEAALAAGASIINDIWGFKSDPAMAELASSGQYLSILMHNQTGTDYAGDVVAAVKRGLDQSVEIALKAGLNREKIILDPGIGFGKTVEHNWTVLSRIDEIVSMGFPVLLGTSRKGFLGRLTGSPAAERAAATVATGLYGALKGVHYLRVHDVKEHRQAIQVWERICHDQATHQ